MQEQFIIYENPVLHRENNGSQVVVSGSDNVVLNVIDVPEYLYTCDFCNDDIEVQTDDGKPLSVFVLNNTHALCRVCVKQSFTYDLTMYDRIGWCSCCTNEDVDKYLYIENDNTYSPIARFSTQDQADWFGQLYAGHTGRELICIHGELTEPLQENE